MPIRFPKVLLGCGLAVLLFAPVIAQAQHETLFFCREGSLYSLDPKINDLRRVKFRFKFVYDFDIGMMKDQLIVALMASDDQQVPLSENLSNPSVPEFSIGVSQPRGDTIGVLLQIGSVFIDPISKYAVSPDGRYVSIERYVPGSERKMLYLYDIAERSLSDIPLMDENVNVAKDTVHMLGWGIKQNSLFLQSRENVLQYEIGSKSIRKIATFEPAVDVREFAGDGALCAWIQECNSTWKAIVNVSGRSDTLASQGRILRDISITPQADKIVWISESAPPPGRNGIYSGKVECYDIKEKKIIWTFDVPRLLREKGMTYGDLSPFFGFTGVNYVLSNDTSVAYIMIPRAVRSISGIYRVSMIDGNILGSSEIMSIEGPIKIVRSPF